MRIQQRLLHVNRGQRLHQSAERSCYYSWRSLLQVFQSWGDWSLFAVIPFLISAKTDLHLHYRNQYFAIIDQFVKPLLVLLAYKYYAYPQSQDYPLLFPEQIQPLKNHFRLCLVSFDRVKTEKLGLGQKSQVGSLAPFFMNSVQNQL